VVVVFPMRRFFLSGRRVVSYRCPPREKREGALLLEVSGSRTAPKNRCHLVATFCFVSGRFGSLPFASLQSKSLFSETLARLETAALPIELLSFQKDGLI
jgi:hypothetical protein